MSSMEARGILASVGLVSIPDKDLRFAAAPGEEINLKFLVKSNRIGIQRMKWLKDVQVWEWPLCILLY